MLYCWRKKVTFEESLWGKFTDVVLKDQHISLQLHPFLDSFDHFQLQSASWELIQRDFRKQNCCFYSSTLHWMLLMAKTIC